jgi:S-(hydroxymethyl)glutathione dehydrogenase / alcohol dehydrogenase
VRSPHQPCSAMLSPGDAATIVAMNRFGTRIELHGTDFLRDRKVRRVSMDGNPLRVDTPCLRGLRQQDRLKLDTLICSIIKLQQINEAFAKLNSEAPVRS